MTYYTKDDEGNTKEITRAEAHQAPFDGVQDVDKYLDEIESGKFGRNNVQVAANVYFDTDEEQQPHGASAPLNNQQSKKEI